jgi:hypothetical protein
MEIRFESAAGGHREAVMPQPPRVGERVLWQIVNDARGGLTDTAFVVVDVAWMVREGVRSDGQPEISAVVYLDFQPDVEQNSPASWMEPGYPVPDDEGGLRP